MIRLHYASMCPVCHPTFRVYEGLHSYDINIASRNLEYSYYTARLL